MTGDRQAEALGSFLCLHRSLCTSMRYAHSKCRACLEACTVGALGRGGKTWQLKAECDACGACVSACPTGALDLRAPTTAELEWRIRRRLEASPTDPVLFACERVAPAPREAIRILCAARLDEATLVYGPLRGSTRVRVLVGQCQDCSRHERIGRHFGGALRRARGILEACALDTQAVSVEKSDARGGKDSRGAEEGSNRRGLFRRLLRAAQEPAPAVEAEEPAVPKRLRVARSIRAGGRKSTNGVSSGGGIVTGEIAVSDACLGCPVCQHVCAPGAISRDEAPGGVVRIRFAPARCHACGACEQACLPKAVRMSVSENMDVLASEAKRTVATVAERACDRCGESFPSAGAPRCPRCRRDVADAYPVERSLSNPSPTR